MRLHRRGVDHHLRRRPSSRGQGMKDIAPNPLGRPADKAVVEGLARAMDIRCVHPTAVGLRSGSGERAFLAGPAPALLIGADG